jgi:hypothetical protein
MSDYDINEKEFKRISKKFNHISNSSFYATQIKIAAKEYVCFLNKQTMNTESVNSGVKTSTTFAVKVDGNFVVNKKLVQQSIKRAKKKGEYLLFSFCKANIVLRKLELRLNSRK